MKKPNQGDLVRSTSLGSEGVVRARHQHVAWVQWATGGFDTVRLDELTITKPLHERSLSYGGAGLGVS